MPTLYEINVVMFDLMEELAQNNLPPETVAVLQKQFDDLSASREEKLAAWAGYIKGVESDVEAVDAEIKRLKEKKESYAKRAENSKKYLGYMLNGEKWSNGVHTLSWRKSTAAVWSDPTIPVPEQFARIKTILEPNKEEIKGAILSGARVPGWVVEERRNLQVK